MRRDGRTDDSPRRPHRSKGGRQARPRDHRVRGGRKILRRPHHRQVGRAPRLLRGRQGPGRRDARDRVRAGEGRSGRAAARDQDVPVPRTAGLQRHHRPADRAVHARQHRRVRRHVPDEGAPPLRRQHAERHPDRRGRRQEQPVSALARRRRERDTGAILCILHGQGGQRQRQRRGIAARDDGRSLPYRRRRITRPCGRLDLPPERADVPRAAGAVRPVGAFGGLPQRQVLRRLRGRHAHDADRPGHPPPFDGRRARRRARRHAARGQRRPRRHGWHDRFGRGGHPGCTVDRCRSAGTPLHRLGGREPGEDLRPYALPPEHARQPERSQHRQRQQGRVGRRNDDGLGRGVAERHRHQAARRQRGRYAPGQRADGKRGRHRHREAARRVAPRRPIRGHVERRRRRLRAALRHEGREDRR